MDYNIGYILNYNLYFMVGDKDLDKLLVNLPVFIKNRVNNHPQKEKIIEIIIDLGRRPEARFPNGPEYLSQKIISWQDIDYITKRISKFSDENRAGIEFTLHRISCISVSVAECSWSWERKRKGNALRLAQQTVNPAWWELPG